MKSKIFTIVRALVLVLLIGVGCSESPARPAANPLPVANPTLIPTPTASTPTTTPTPEPLAPTPTADPTDPILSDTDIEIYHELRDASQSVKLLLQAGAVLGPRLAAGEETLDSDNPLARDAYVLQNKLCYSGGNLMDKATDIRLRHAAARLSNSLRYLWISLSRAGQGKLEVHKEILAEAVGVWEAAQDPLDSVADDLERSQ